MLRPSSLREPVCLSDVNIGNGLSSFVRATMAYHLPRLLFFLLETWVTVPRPLWWFCEVGAFQMG